MFKKRHLYAGQSFGHPHRLRTWLRAHKKMAIIGSASLVLVIAAGGVIAYKLITKPTPVAVTQKPTPKKETPPPPPKYYSMLTGLEVHKDHAERPLTAIMIENSPDARPQSGLKDAGVVFEAIAEGGITRFLAIYQEGQPQLVGPVRSLRMYYVDWLAAFNPSIAHIGGSAKALQTVRNGSFRDIDQFFNAGAYWRAKDRYAPHNVYTSFAKLDELNKAKGYYTKPSFTSFVRKGETPPITPNATKIQVKISSALYNSTYTYDRASNSYLRSHQATGLHIDRESNQQLRPKVVVVMKVQEKTVLEDGYRQAIQAVGSGDVWVFQDGTVNHGIWRKNSQKEQITFTNDAGEVLKLNPGQTWLTAIPHTQTVTWQP